jgi:hypothetical protein
VRVLCAALCVAALGCREPGPSPRLDTVEPSVCYNDEAVVLVLSGSFEAPVQAELNDPSRSRLAPYAVQLVSGDQVIDLPNGAFREPGRIEAALELGTPPGIYSVQLTDPWGQSTSLPDALTVRFRFPLGDGGLPDVDPPASGPVRTPPQARITVSPPLDLAVGVLGNGVQFDASGSVDTLTRASELEVSWNFSWPTSSLTWTSWTKTKTDSAFLDAGVVDVVLAVRDMDRDVAYATRAISVAPSDADLCIVTTPLPIDDGAFDCSGGQLGKGVDGKLSLDEAARLSKQMVGNQTILLLKDPTLPPEIFTGPPLTLDSAVQIVGMPGAILGRELIASSVPITLISVEVAGPGNADCVQGQACGKLTVPQGMKLDVLDSYLHDTGIVSIGRLAVQRTRIENCSGACITLNGPSAELSASGSSFRGAGSGYAIDAPQCVGIGDGYSLDLVANTFAGFATAIRVGPGCVRPARIVHQTFHGNDVAVHYLGGDGHVLRNNIFSAQMVTPVRGCAVSFAADARRDHLLYANASNGCLQDDPGILTINPQFISSGNGDFRLRYGSPAVDSAPDTGLDVNGAAPDAYQGAGPDFGGRETY